MDKETKLKILDKSIKEMSDKIRRSKAEKRNILDGFENAYYIWVYEIAVTALIKERDKLRGDG